MGDISLQEVAPFLELTDLSEAMKIVASYREEMMYNNNPRRSARQFGFGDDEEDRCVAKIAEDIFPSWH